MFGDHLTITRQMVAFNRDSDYRLDMEAFEANVNSASARAPEKRLQEAVELYRGDFLDGFYVRGAPEFEVWVLAQRAYLCVSDLPDFRKEEAPSAASERIVVKVTRC